VVFAAKPTIRLGCFKNCSLLSTENKSNEMVFGKMTGGANWVWYVPSKVGDSTVLEFSNWKQPIGCIVLPFLSNKVQQMKLGEQSTAGENVWSNADSKVRGRTWRGISLQAFTPRIRAKKCTKEIALPDPVPVMVVSLYYASSPIHFGERDNVQDFGIGCRG
jgi:hypothetical protein